MVTLWYPKDQTCTIKSWPSHFIKADGIKVNLPDKKFIKTLFAVGTNTLGYSNKDVNKVAINAINETCYFKLLWGISISRKINRDK